MTDIINISDDNLVQLDQLQIQITLGEIMERTLSSFIVWTIVNPTTFTTRFNDFDLTLSTVNGQGDLHIDVLRFGVHVLTIQSVIFPAVTDLANIVQAISASPDFYDELITRAYETYIRCPQWEWGNGGCEVGGFALVACGMFGSGGVIVNGSSENVSKIRATGGIIIGGHSPQNVLRGPVLSLGGAVVGNVTNHLNYVPNYTPVQQLFTTDYNNTFRRFNILGCGRIAVHPTLDRIYVLEVVLGGGPRLFNVYTKSGILKQSLPVATSGFFQFTPSSMVVGDGGTRLYASIGNGITFSTGDGIYYLPIDSNGLIAGDPYNEGTISATMTDFSLDYVALDGGVVGLTVDSSHLYINALYPQVYGGKITRCNWDGSGQTDLFSGGAYSGRGYYGNMRYRPIGLGPIWGDGQIVGSPPISPVFTSGLVYNNAFASENQIALDTSTYTKEMLSNGVGLAYDSGRDLFYYAKCSVHDYTVAYLFSYNPNTTVETNITVMDIPWTDQYDQVTYMDYDNATQRLFVSTGRNLFVYQT